MVLRQRTKIRLNNPQFFLPSSTAAEAIENVELPDPTKTFTDRKSLSTRDGMATEHSPPSSPPSTYDKTKRRLMRSRLSDWMVISTCRQIG
jgi:hypothetical protein